MALARLNWRLLSIFVSCISAICVTSIPGKVDATPVLQNEVEPNDTTGTANALTFGSQSAATVAGTIGVAGNFDFYSFSATAGDRVWIDVDTGSPPAQVGSSRDSIVDLFDTNGTTLIETDDDDGTGSGGDGSNESGLASVIAARVLPNTGTYFIRVRAFSGTATIDPYRLYVHVNNAAPSPETEPNDSAATANPGIVPPGVVGFKSGALTPGDNDFYSASLQAGDIVLIALDGDPGRDGMSTNAVFQLRDTDGASPIITADSGSTSGGFNAQGLVFNVPVTGTYFVRVFGGSGNSVGDYTLLVDDTDGFNGCTITCPANQMAAENPPGSGGAMVTYDAPTVSPACGVVICSPASGSTFPVGATTVTCQQEIIGLVNGVTPGCQFTVTVTVAGETPTATPTSTSTGTVTNTATATGTATNTATATNTGTATQTPTATPTNTGIPQGGACSTPAECATGFCLDGVCCNTACNPDFGRCDLPGQRGTCAGVSPAPTLTPRALAVAAALLIGVAAFALRRRAVRR